jgi:imidazolonepropionase-like amidohydrolase
MNGNSLFSTILTALILVFSTALCAQEEAPSQVLITNVKIFNGVDDKLVTGQSVLIEGNLIKQVGPKLSADGAEVIDGGGRTLMPGLIDMHSHLAMQEGLYEGRDNWDQMAMGAMTAHVFLDYLDQGFTTAMDLGGNTLGMAKAVNAGRIPGPRIFPSGGFLTQTGGHADMGVFSDGIDTVNNLERHGFGYIADGVPEVQEATRYNFARGATQVKIMAGGGVSSAFDPIHTTQYSPEEIKAIVEVAKDYGTFATVHAYHDRSINRALDAGVRVIQHGFLMSEPTVKRMAKEGIALNLQAVMSVAVFAEPEKITFFTADQKAKATLVHNGSKQMIKWALKHDVLIVSGGDMFGSDLVGKQASNITILPELGFTPIQALRSATSDAAEVLSWTGEMNPYKYGTLGTIAEGGYADLILVDGNPLEDLEVLQRDKVDFVMKDGAVYKNTLD